MKQNTLKAIVKIIEILWNFIYAHAVKSDTQTTISWLTNWKETCHGQGSRLGSRVCR